MLYVLEINASWIYRDLKILRLIQDFYMLSLVEIENRILKFCAIDSNIKG